VETTNPYGFDPGNRREFHDEFGRVTGFAYVSARDYRNRRSVGPLELVSLILANRIVAAESAGRFAEAVGYAIDRRALLSLGVSSGSGAPTGEPTGGNGPNVDAGLFPDAERELLERLLNYGVSLAQRSREAEALAWADSAIDRFGSHVRWNDFIHSALNNLTIRLVQAGKYGEAYANLEAYSDRLETQVQRDLFRIVVEAELVKRVQGIAAVQEAEAIFSALDDALAEQTLPAERVRELQVFVGLRMTEKIAKASGNRPALTYLDALQFSADRRIQDARKIYRSNIIAEFHNEFARLFNQRDYEKARKVIAQALAEFPQEKRLKDDLALLEKTAR
jgi:tetratricopeptide (TPR) repeat protein